MFGEGVLFLPGLLSPWLKAQVNGITVEVREVI